MTGPARPELAALLELDALLGRIELLAREGDRQRYDTDDNYRWVLHRLWIAVGNQAAVLEPLAGEREPWTGLRRQRNDLAHRRLSDIDEDVVWRMTMLRPASLRARLRETWR